MKIAPEVARLKDVSHSRGYFRGRKFRADLGRLGGLADQCEWSGDEERQGEQSCAGQGSIAPLEGVDGDVCNHIGGNEAASNTCEFLHGNAPSERSGVRCIGSC